jgi:glycosyltransferase involved in cell wall biosynthesis
LVVPVLALGLPLMDTLLAVIRRVSRRASVFTADKDHIHHRLVASGFTRRQALFLLYGLSICLASLSLLVAFSNSFVAGLVIAAAAGLIGLLARFAEADVVRDFGVMVLGRIRGNGQSPLAAQAAPTTGAAPLPAAVAPPNVTGQVGQVKSAESATRRPRVAFLTPLPTPYRQPLLERLVGRPEMDVVVYYFSAAEEDRSWNVAIPKDPRFRVLQGKSLAFTGKKSFFNHWNPDLFRELDEGKFDLIVVPGYALLSSQAAIAWAWLRKRPYVISSESHLAEPRSWLRRAIKRVMLRTVISRAAACLATGTLSKEYLCRYGARPENVFFFPNTPDVDWFTERSEALRPRCAELRKKWAIPDAPTVIYVGRLMQVKGVDVLVRAFAQVAEQIPNAQLLIVGDGPEESALRGLVNAHRLNASVHFLGFQQRDELVELYVCADLFCLPSRHEPWGVVVNEAAACALPLVVSDRVGAGPDLVREGTNGYVVPAEDVQQFAARIAEMLIGGAAAPGWAAGSRSIAAEWGYRRAVEQFRQTCDHVLKNTGRRAAI